MAVLDPGEEGLARQFGRWRPVSLQQAGFFDLMMRTLRERLDEDFESVRPLLGDINNLQCLVQGSLDSELGFKVFANGFSMNLDARLKDRGVKYIFERQQLEWDGETREFLAFGVVECDGLRPVRLRSFTVQEGIHAPERRFSISLEDLSSSNSKWITTLQDGDVANKMVRISGWNDYNQTLGLLNDYAKRGGGYLDALPEKTRVLLLNYIITRIGYFEHRDLMINEVHSRSEPIGNFSLKQDG